LIASIPTCSSRLARWGFALAAILLSAGCASQQSKAGSAAVTSYFIGDFHGAVERLRPLAEKTDENFVLNNVRLGSAALVQYDLDDAESAFLRAYEVMNSVGVNDGGRSLGAVLVDEKIKIWKGEPFERAMANFYLGLVYYMRHDYGNARAAFENALFKLKAYDNPKKNDSYQEAESDFALAYLMLARSYQRLGRDADAAKNFQRAVELRGYLEPLADPERNKRSNVLLVVDYGLGPKKGAEFDGSVVAFAPTPQQAGMIPPVRVMIDGRHVSLEGVGRPPVDLLALAQDRKWQSIDTIRAFKSVAGTGLIAGGAGYGIYRSANSNHGISGGDAAITAGLIGAGLLLKATSQADTRQWEMLPRTVFLLPLELPPGRHDVTVEFTDVGVRQQWRNLIVPEQGEATYYFRMQRHNPGPFEWPPQALAGITPEP
jgi:tetratricopeptide (TPR) repeat protein